MPRLCETELSVEVYGNGSCLLTGESAEDACTHASRQCGIGPIARHLFGLYHEDAQTWLSPCENLNSYRKTKLQFRLRFKLPEVAKLLSIDPAAYDYYFLQVRQDFLNGKISEMCKAKELALGLAVTDMLRVKLEKDLPGDVVDNDFKNYLPQEVTRQYKYMSRYVRQAMKRALAKLEQNRPKIAFVKEQYIQQILELKPTYGCEEYTAQVDENGRVVEVRLQMNPYDTKQPGLNMQMGSKKAAWTHLCSIEELCYISMRKDCTVEISRRNGVPQYFKFSSVAKMHSFVSLMDGYYRLAEKWTFNLCKDLPTPSLQDLKVHKCHGPVGPEFAYKKLQEKAQNQPGTYLLREHIYYGAYRLDLLLVNGQDCRTFPIESTPNGFQMEAEETTNRFATLQELLTYYTKEKRLGTCIPPSEYDKSPLLLCRVQNTEYTTTKKVSKEPHCINLQNLHLRCGVGNEWCGNFTIVQSATWQRALDPVSCAVKSLKTVHKVTYLQEFLQMANTCVFWHCEGIATMYGFVLSPPMLVMEYFLLGPLDRYLQQNGDSVEEVDLVEAATYLAKALWYLEEENLCHGNIRCHNVFVAQHEGNAFKVKLMDIGLPHYDPSQIHWIPPECYVHPQTARQSLPADVWAFGTTLWEIFSYGTTPLQDATSQQAKDLYLKGTRLSQPHKCHEDIYKLMKECWFRDPDARKKPQAIMRDINQTLYEVYNSRRTHAYATLINNQACSDNVSNSSGSLSNKATLPATPEGLQRKFTNGNHCIVNNHPEGSDSDSAKWSMSSFPEHAAAEAMAGMNDVNRQPTHFPSSPSGTSLMSMEQDQEWIIERNQLELRESEKLGQGFYGEVYKAWLTRWSGLDREEVAVKKLRKSNTSAGLQDLIREIVIMKALSHKNIVEIKGVVEDPEMLLIMEFMPRGSLLVHLRTYRDHLTERQLLKFAADVAEGMEYLGHKHIVHRDLAARNILVASDDTVKISDFGLAQMMGQKDYYRLKTNRDLPIRWYAPETISCWRFTHKSDVWSYGVTLWEMFSFGEEPILESCKDDELLKTLDSGKRLNCPPSCSHHIYSYMKRCWESDPQDRPSFTELLALLTSLQV